MNILLLGGGGREHAFAWKISQSPHCQQLFIAPGNAGTAQCGTNIALSPNDFEAQKAFCLEKNIEMVVVGPEEPLVRGVYDFYQKEADLQHIQVIGPSAEGAQLEGSKAYAKQFMADKNIPTAAYRSFSQNDLQEGLAYLADCPTPIVLKADGLAAGKGVLICQTREEAQREFEAMLGGKFGQASSKIVVEAFLDGIEFSVFVLSDGQHYQILPIAKDYKRIGEGDTGLNTGGMGAISPVSFVDETLMKKVEERIIQPTISGLQEKGIVYQGFIFIGLIKVQDEPYVIEYNCRMGDPETEVVLPRLKNDLLDLFIAIKEKKLDQVQIEMEQQFATTVMLVSGGYPQAYEKGKVIEGAEQINNSLVFHAGTRKEGDQILTNGGRVIAITSFGENMAEALQKSRENAERIDFQGKYYRKDIGFDL